MNASAYINIAFGSLPASPREPLKKAVSDLGVQIGQLPSLISNSQITLHHRFDSETCAHWHWLPRKAHRLSFSLLPCYYSLNPSISVTFQDVLLQICFFIPLNNSSRVFAWKWRPRIWRWQHPFVRVVLLCVLCVTHNICTSDLHIWRVVLFATVI